ncbi:MAG: DUF2490 domain-containing protein [Bacteroidetes bacterium]|nr:DUF2490 domain-containing protein [Bacteroidota bacterium]
MLRSFSLLACFILCCFQLHSKTYSPVYADAGSWNTFNITYKLNKHYSILFTEELRFRENYSRLNLFYTNIGFEYKLNKNFKTSLVYRWIDKFMDDNTFSYRHRLQWDASFKLPINDFSLAYRSRLQAESRNVMSSESGKVPEWYWRNKFDIGYAFNKKLSASVSTEMRYQLSDPRNEESDGTWHRIRFQGGFDYKYTKQSTFGIYYLVQKEFNVSAPEDIYITGLEYSLSLGK